MILSALCVVLLCLLFDFRHVEAQVRSPGVVVSSQDVSNFQPGIGILMGAVFITFLLACVLLVYTRFYLNSGSSSVTPGSLYTRSGSVSSGIEKSVIESLPFFRFSSLRGSKEGLECSVCLSTFQDVEIIRILPQCKHAFHVGCIDRWLEGSSSCPLCRQRLDPEDPRIFTYSNSMRSLVRNYSRSITGDAAGFETELQPYVQREVDKSRRSSRTGLGSSLRRLFGSSSNDTNECDSVQRPKDLHRFNHRIIVPQVIFNNRWSDVRSSDLMFLNSEMINIESSDKLFKAGQSTPEGHVITIRSEMELKRSLDRKFALSNRTSPASGSDPGKLLVRDEKRTMSEITAQPRFSAGEEEEDRGRTRRLWLPIAKRTVEWFANREKRPEEPQNQFSENTSSV